MALSALDRMTQQIGKLEAASRHRDSLVIGFATRTGQHGMRALPSGQVLVTPFPSKTASISCA
jgi:hypothetical protein